MIYTDEMYHFGVKGMKWGVRNAETQAKYAGGKGPSKRQIKKSNKFISKRLARENKILAKNKKTYQENEELIKNKKNRYVDLATRSGMISKKKAQKYADAYFARDERWQAFGKNLIAKQETKIKSLKSIDTSSMSYKDAKKRVKEILRESNKSVRNNYSDYVNNETLNTVGDVMDAVKITRNKR